MNDSSLLSFRCALVALLFPVLSVVASPPVEAQQVLVAEGGVYFWRPGRADWRPIEPSAQLSAGDAVYAGNGATAEILIGPNDFLRLTSNTQISLMAQDVGLLQIRVASGVASFDLRSPSTARIVEIDTPNAVFVVGGSGYYRVDVQPNRTRFVTRRGGRATLSLADGRTRGIAANEEVVIEGGAGAVLQNRIVIETDTWDRWNDARSDYYATNGIGVVWIDLGRREHFGRPVGPAPRWEHHDMPPPGGWARPPVRPPTPMPIQPPAQPIRPPEIDHRPPHRDFHDRRDDDHGRHGSRSDPSVPATPAVGSTIRPPSPTPAPVAVPVIPTPRPVPAVPTPAPAPAPIAAPRLPGPSAVVPLPGPVPGPAPAPGPAPRAEPPIPRSPGGDRPHPHRPPEGLPFPPGRN